MRIDLEKIIYLLLLEKRAKDGVINLDMKINPEFINEKRKSQIFKYFFDYGKIFLIEDYIYPEVVL